MSTRYVTLTKNDPNFSTYLWGTSDSNQSLAVPIKSYNLGTLEESVTFEIKNKSELQIPNFFYLLSALVKVRSFIILLFPVLYVLLTNLQHKNFDLLSFLFAFISAILLFAGLNIRNDVYDHISGYDRVNIDSSLKPIRLGWITAKKASQISVFLISLAALFSVPTMLLNPQVLWVAAVSFILFLLGRFAKNNSYKNQHFGELVLFLLVGPNLSLGFQLAADVPLNLQVVVFGILWGMAVLFLIQLNNFSHIMTSSQNGIRNTITKLGFDLAPKFLVFCWTAFLAVWCIHKYLFFQNIAGLMSTLLLGVISARFYIQILNIKSPMGSGLKKARQAGYYVFLSAVALLLVQTVFTFLI